MHYDSVHVEQGKMQSTSNNIWNQARPEPVPGVFNIGGHLDQPPLPNTDPAVGMRLHHVMMRIRDPERSLQFYRDLLGMRLVWTLNTGPFTIYYLGFPSTDGDRADLKYWAEHPADFAAFTRTTGFLELKHMHGAEKPLEEGGIQFSNGNAPPHLGFGHLGFTVPHVPSILARLKDAGAPVVKDLRYNGRASIPLTEWEKERGVGVGDMVESYKETIKQVAMVEDPDGYYVELVPQNLQTD
ncbi:Lactoylglutathione lyase [Colletotrichum fructicola Nara gc5]|uniref:Lactoylglutathione lyase n=1 Tax=Colletotrichum fructicola (strain Nara gc5) TaxID=1213859 RepID=A0A7J6JLE9_COLFN|nr:Lactoylglutathione lyase [Colletotrichum fructicola]KAF4491238.1 Lactoylglutathione lyase [Colletotrichum fructicola Nara gc5]KAF5513278.1 Lactoylglutathione lyase [Colletotrichum fructicola]